LLAGFDALGGGPHPEAARQPDDGADDRDRLRIDADIIDEGFVDLDLVERESLQIGERGVAGAEIVEREGHAERAQSRHVTARRLVVAEQHRLRDFQL